MHARSRELGQSFGNMAAGGQLEKNACLVVRLLGPPIWETMPGLSQKLCVPTHAQVPAGFLLRTTCGWTRLAEGLPFAFLEPPFRERKKEGW